MSASLTFSKGARYDFLVAVFDQGWLLAIMEAQEEALTTEGVNGTRFREIFQQHPIQTMRTLASAADFGAAKVLAAAYKTSLLATKIVSISITTPALIDALSNVHVIGCKPVPIAGPLAGAGGTPQASVLTTWTLQLTDAS